MNQCFLTLCLSIEVNLCENTPETNTWHVCMSVSVCQSDSVGQEEQDKEVENKEAKEEGKDEEDGFIRALS